LSTPAKPKPGEPVKISEFTKDLSCSLTRDQLLMKGARRAQLDADMGAHESHADDVKAELKAKEAKIRAEAHLVSLQIRTQSEIRQVPCTRFADYETNKMFETRDDTGEVVDTRALTPEERQLGLEFKAEGVDEKFDAAAKKAAEAVGKKKLFPPPIDDEPPKDAA
jgi:hypothetical protein